MHYFSHISNTYSLKNNLEKYIYKILCDHNRKIIPAENIEHFIDSIKKAVEDGHKAFPRCKPIRLDFWQPKISVKDDPDYVLHMGAGICNFYLYASRD